MATYISISCNVLFLIRGLYIRLHNIEFIEVEDIGFRFEEGELKLSTI